MNRIVFALASLALATALHAAEPAKPQVMISLTFGEGDPHSKREGGGKVLSAPTILTQDGQSANVLIGGELPLNADEVWYVQYGVRCEVRPEIQKDGKVLLEIEYSRTDPVKNADDSKSQIIVAGDCLRGSMLLTPGETLLIRGQDSTGKTRPWLKAKVELVERPDVVKPASAEIQEKDAAATSDTPPRTTRLASRPHWPTLKQRYQGGPKEMIKGPFGHGK